MNQQLVDYIKQQLQLGVSKEAIKTTLQNSGWAETDITTAMNSILPGQSPVSSNLVNPLNQGVSSGATQPKTATAVASPVSTSDIFQPKTEKPLEDKPREIKPEMKTDTRIEIKTEAKNEPVFQPKFQKMAASPSEPALNEIKISTAPRKPVLLIVSLLLTLVFLAAAVFLFMENRNLKSDLENASSNSSLQMDSLNQEKNELSGKVKELEDETKGLKIQLSFFATPIAGSALSEEEVVIKGVLGGGDSGYYLTTPEQIVISVKNSKEAKIINAFKPLLGTLVDVGGTRILGSKEITAKSINKFLIEEVSQSSTLTPTSTSTSTPSQ